MATQNLSPNILEKANKQIYATHDCPYRQAIKQDLFKISGHGNTVSNSPRSTILQYRCVTARGDREATHTFVQ